MPSKPNAVTKVNSQGLTSVREWHQARVNGVPFHFPSGRVSLVRPVSLKGFLKAQQIPDMLTSVVSQFINGSASLETIPVTEYTKSLEIIDSFIMDAFVWPKVVETPDEISDPDNEIAVEDISDVDKQTLFQFLGAPASALESFRPEPIKPVADMVNGQGDKKDA